MKKEILYILLKCSTKEVFVNPKRPNRSQSNVITPGSFFFIISSSLRLTHGWPTGIFWSRKASNTLGDKVLLKIASKGWMFLAWQATIAFSIIGWCWESNHERNFCFPLHWWLIDRGQDCCELTWKYWICWGRLT